MLSLEHRPGFRAGRAGRGWAGSGFTLISPEAGRAAGPFQLGPNLTRTEADGFPPEAGRALC